ncbi:MAG TPA: STAS domain-containing protein [Acidimicrobiales bacterium]|nr:STAS domain-containing protein [Acidimicrobiales bacterium]
MRRADEMTCGLLIIEGQPTIRGECDNTNAPAIESWLSSFGKSAIDVDLRGVTFFDAAALRAFLSAWERNPNMRIVQPSATVCRVLTVTGAYRCLVDGVTLS